MNNMNMMLKQSLPPLFTTDVVADCKKYVRKFTYRAQFTDENTYVNYTDNILKFSKRTDVENF